MGKPFSVGERVFYRETLGRDPDAPYHLLCPTGAGGAGGVRRWLTETQLDGATTDHAADVSEAQQAILSALWNRLEPEHAGYHPGTQIPLRYCGLDVQITESNPEVKGPGWQGDTVSSKTPVPPNMKLIVERAVWVNPPIPQPAEVDAAQILDLLRHESVELCCKGEIVDRRWPFISDAARAVCLDEMEGPAHLSTIGRVEGYCGADAERRYLRELDYPIMRQRGFGKLVDSWEKTDL